MNKILLLLITFTISTVLLSAQNNSGISVNIEHPKMGDNSFINRYFQGGENGFRKYFEENLKYPLLLVDIDMEGEVNLKFRIGKGGKATDIEILRGFDPLADDEVVAAIEKMPEWGAVPADESDTGIKLTVSFALNNELKERLKEEAKKEQEAALAEKENVSVEKSSSNKIVVKKDSVEIKSPEFPGGQEALDEFLKVNMKYPKRAIQMKIEGRVLYNITVTEDGEITNIKLFKGIFIDCNEEAFYLIKKMPKWTPGTRNGKVVKMDVLLPIPFVLPK
ncbi:MAG: TonB family protein [Prevotella sp.]|jgi:TonB family protein|nr:TonB family protein [Prevotella sp.]